MKDFITEWGGVAGALASIITLLTTVVRPVFALKRDVEAMKENDLIQTAQLLKNRLDLLRLTMYAAEMPLTERVNAGEEYIKAGGNGAAKVQHEANVRALREGAGK